ncbi:hypothetical protein TNCV_4984911 [Trichonephila clavipes]|nr:hypothetical protein TNCV_4984911 [Trichonephila clavipes]
MRFIFGLPRKVDGETAEFLTDDDIAAAVTQEPMEEEVSDDETQCDKKDVVPHADGAAALDLALRYLEQQPDTIPADVLFMRRWRNYASSKRLSSLRQKKITELMKICSRVGQIQTSVMRMWDHWIKECTTDRRGRSHPPQCTTSRETDKLGAWQ